MPIYEYRCTDCGTQFELRRKFGQADDPLVCPDCRSAAVRRLLSRFIAFTASSSGARLPVSGGCACGGACACGSQN